jgi:hypothetical protein
MWTQDDLGLIVRSTTDEAKKLIDYTFFDEFEIISILGNIDDALWDESSEITPPFSRYVNTRQSGVFIQAVPYENMIYMVLNKTFYDAKTTYKQIQEVANRLQLSKDYY